MAENKKRPTLNPLKTSADTPSKTGPKTPPISPNVK